MDRIYPNTFRPTVRRNLLLGAAITLVCSTGFSTMALAAPDGGVVVGGNITIDQTLPTTTVVTQTTDRGIIDWRSFDVNTNELVEFKQPNVQSITVNRVKNSTQKTEINGSIKANGNIVILNENGVMFGENSRIDVGGLVASTSDLLDDADFMAGGNVRFKHGNNPNAGIENRGNITAREGGLVGLVSPNVENKGVITAKFGKVQIASADIVTIDFAGDGLIQIDVSNNVTKQIIKQSGIVSADGGEILLTAAAGRAVVDSVISVGGVVQSRAVGGRSGKVTIEAKGSNKTVKTGNSNIFTKNAYIDVSGRNAGEKGGNLKILADQIVLGQGTFIDASGANANITGTNFRSGSAAYTADNQVRSEAEFLNHNYRAGGSVMIGGDYLGLGQTQTAKNLVVDKNVYVFNDSLLNGDAGRTIFWSDGTTDFRGNVFSRGGVAGGHGGFLETSGKDRLRAVGYADLTNRDFRFRKGTYLLDPTDITIRGSFLPTDISGLEIWVDASNAGSITSAAGIISAVNSLVNGRVASVSSTGGNIRTGISTQNGLNVLSFDGAARLVFSGVGLGSNLTAFGLVQSATATWNDNGMIASSRAGNGFIIHPDAGSGATRYFGVDGLGNYVFHGYGNASNIMNYNIYSVGVSTTEVFYGANNRLIIVGGQSRSGSPITNTVAVGGDDFAGRELNGNYSEFFLYNSYLAATDRNLLSQYQSAKWNVTLDPIAGAGSEATEAMASIQKGDAADGYSVFTTRYLERLSQTANISLRSSNNITLDLRGDTLNLSTANRSITLQAGNQILTASAGEITTNNGAINMTAPNGILFNHNFTLNSNGGAIALNNNVTIGTGANLTINGGTANNTIGTVISGAGSLTKQGSGTLTLSGYNTYTGGTTVNAGALTLSKTGPGPIGTIVGALTINSGATVNTSTTNWELGYGAGQNVTDIVINGGTLNFTGSNANGGYAGNNITLNGGSITGSQFDWYSAGTLAGTLNVTGNATSVGINLRSQSGAGNITVNASGANTLTISGNIINNQGSSGLIKTGTGTLTLTGANTYTGTTLVNAGTLRAGSTSAFGNNSATTVASGTILDLAGFNNSIGSLAGAGTVTNSNPTAATLTAGGDNTSTTFSGVAQNGNGTLALTKAGTGTLTLGSSVNTYTGGTTVNAGTLTLPSISSSGHPVGVIRGSLVINSGAQVNAFVGWSLGSNSPTSVSDITINNGVLNFTGAVGLGGISANSITLNGGSITGTKFDWYSNGPLAVALNATANVSTVAFDLRSASGNGLVTANVSAGQTLTVNGVISSSSGVNGITKTGTGTLLLSGANTYTGATIVNAGTLRAGSISAFGNNNATTVASGATLDLAGFNNSIGSLAGAGTVTNSNATAATLTAGGNNTSTTFSGVAQNGTGTLALTKAGTGTLTLTGANTYSGTTTVNAGTLNADISTTQNSIGTGAASVASGATLNLNNLNTSGTVVAVSNTFSGAGTLGVAFATGGSARNTNINGLAGFTGNVNLSTSTTTADKLNLLSNIGGNLTIGNNTTISIGSNRTITNGTSVIGTGNLEGLGALRADAILTSNVTLLGNSNLGSQIAAGTINGVISGAFGITKVGSNTLTLSGANTYTGTTTVSTGTLAVTNANGLGTGPVNISGPSAVLNSTSVVIGNNVSYATVTGSQTGTVVGGFGTWNSITTPNGLYLNGSLISGCTGTGGTCATASALINGAINPLTAIGATAGWTISGIISGGNASSQLFIGSGLSNGLTTTAVNTYSGDTSVNSGTFTIGGAGSLGAGNYVGAITLLNGRTLQYSSSAAQTLSGIISGTGNILKDTNTSTLILSGANTYSGTTTVNAGTLNLSGSLNVGAGTANTVVASGATLSGAGVLTAGTLNHSGAGTVNLTGNNMITNLTTSGSIGDFALNNAQSFSTGAITTAAGRTINLSASGAGNTITTTGALAVGALGNISLTADDLVLGANLSGTGVLTLMPTSINRIVNVNNGVADGTNFNISTAEIGRFVDGWGNIIIGRLNGSDSMFIGGSTWTDPITFRNNFRVQQNGPLTATGNGSFNIVTNSAGWFNPWTITTAGGSVTANTAMTSGANITTNGGAITVGTGSWSSFYVAGSVPDFTWSSGGGNITILDPMSDNPGAGSTVGRTATINAGTGNVSFASTINGQYNLSVSGGNVTFGGAIGNTTNLGAVNLASTAPMILPAINATSLLVNGTAYLNGNITTNNGTMIFNNPVFLTGNRTLNAGAGAITFNGTINSLLPVATVQSLVVAGGGGGGGGTGGGGGAGGVLYNAALGVTGGTNYAVTVGAGGTRGTGLDSGGTNGMNSVFNGQTAIGGGGGGSNNTIAGLAGGSGGGGSWATGRGTGVVGQGNIGGLGAAAGPPNYGAGGGGGAGSVGGTGTTTMAGNGGNGASYSITGSSVTYGGGGGGGIFATGVNFGLGGTGGGGNGGSNSINGTNGTNGLGGGGGGAGNNTGNGGNGGTGVVILRYTGSVDNAIVTGGTSTTVGGDTVWTFTGNGSFTPVAGGCAGGCNLTLNGSSVAMNGAVGATTRLGALSVNAVNALTLPDVNVASLFAQNTGAGADIIMNGNINANGAGTAVTLVSADDFSNASNRTITTGGAGGRYLIYSDRPADNTNGGLNGFRRYSCTYGGSCPSFASETGNGFLFSSTPVLTATPNALANRQYGSAVPNLTGYLYTLSGYFDAADSSADVVTGTLNGTTSYTLTSATGTNHNINYVSGTLVSSLGYNFTYVNNSTAFSVIKRDITAIVQNKSRVYGDANPIWTHADVTWGNLANSENGSVIDTLSFTPITLTNTSGATSSQVIGITGFNDNNYNLVSSNAGALTVMKRDITAVVGNASRAYGAANPTLNHANVTWSNLANLENGSVIDTLALTAPSATNTSNAGTAHTILISSFNDNNYNLIGQTTGTLSITKAMLTATAQNTSRAYGDANPVFTINYTGFANLESQSVIDTLATASSAATLTSNAGTSHAIVASGAFDNNYDFTYVDGTLTINKRDITAIVQNKSRVYGDANPSWTHADVTWGNLANSENGSVIDTLSFTPITLTQTSGATSSQVIGITGFNDDNYNLVSSTAGTLTVAKANLTLIAEDQRRRQGEPNMVFTYIVAGLKNGELASSMVSNVTIGTIANQISPMGRYAITIADGVAQSNYQITNYINGELRVINANYIPATVERAVQDQMSMPDISAKPSTPMISSDSVATPSADSPKDILVMDDIDIKAVKEGDTTSSALIIISKQLLEQLNRFEVNGYKDL